MKAGAETGAEPTLARALETLAEVAGRLGAAEVAEQVAEAAGRLRALVLEVAVVGELKRGKSSLINALLGRQVLPVGVLPLTAVPTVLERGEEGLLVEYADGRREQHTLDQLARFATEDANPANTLGVTRVTTRLHAPLLDDGVRLVDTPGSGLASIARASSTCCAPLRRRQRRCRRRTPQSATVNNKPGRGDPTMSSAGTPTPRSWARRPTR